MFHISVLSYVVVSLSLVAALFIGTCRYLRWQYFVLVHLVLVVFAMLVVVFSMVYFVSNWYFRWRICIWIGVFGILRILDLLFVIWYLVLMVLMFREARAVVKRRQSIISLPFSQTPPR